jgi:NAD+ synthase (glutamine-hydrolysing)
VLTTGNKSEMALATPPCTATWLAVRGDQDVFKTRVGAVALRNSLANAVIPDRARETPSAELRPDQVDQDSLPPYDVLDAILVAYVEEDRSLDEIVRLGHPPELVRRVVRMVDVNEYKRRQAPPGVKVSARAFGRDRRLPITNRYRDNG